MGTDTTNRAGTDKKYPLVMLPANANKNRFGMKFNNASTGFKPNEIENFQRGLLRRDFDMVERALDAGVPVNTPVKGMHALQVLLYEALSADFPLKNAAFPEGMTMADISAQTSRLVDLILSKDVDLTDMQAFRTEYATYLVDTLLTSNRLADASNVVLHTLFQKLEKSKGAFGYETDIQNFVMGYVDRTAQNVGENLDVKAAISEALRLFKSLHDVVRLRLENPGTVVEMGLVYKYAEQIAAWTENYAPPPIQMFLPDRNGDIGGKPNGNNDNERPSGGQSGKPDAKEKYAAEMEQIVIKLEKKTPERVLAEMEDEFVGMEAQKRNCRKLSFMKAFEAGRKMHNLPEGRKNHSTIYMGPPGVGKTTAARKKAELLHSLDLVGPNYAEITREKLVGAYIGHTEEKWLALLSKADVIFIDEAYSLFDGRNDSPDFGKHIINALLTVLENDPTKTIFLAGYKDKMEAFLNSNEGLRSRIVNFEEIEPMDKPQLGKVLDLMLAKGGFDMDDDAKELATNELEKARTKLGPEYFGNAREVRKIIEKLPEQIAERLFSAPVEEGKLIIIGENGKGTHDRDTFRRAKKSDIEAMNLPMLLGGKESGNQKRGIGFMAKI